MNTRNALATLCAAAATAASLSATPAALAASQTLWSTSVPETSSPSNTVPWTNETYAQGQPACTDCNNSNCQYSTNSTNGNTTPLTAVDFQNFTLAGCSQITGVRFEVSCRYNTNTTAGIEIRAFAPNFGIDSGWRSVPNFTSVTNCADRLGAIGDITGLRSSWTAQQINDLRLQVRRKAGINNNVLRVVSMRMIVTTAGQPLPAAPSNVRTTGRTASSVALAWNDNASNEAGYRVWRVSANGQSWQFFDLPANATSFTDTGLAGGTSYTFIVQARSQCPNEEDNFSTAISVMTTSQHPWINELQLQGSVDSFEIAAPVGTNLSAYSVAVYTRTPESPLGFLYQTHPLGAGVNPNNGISFRNYMMGNLPSLLAGFAIVHNASGQVIEFVSHDCSMIAANGPAFGVTSVGLPFSLLNQPTSKALTRRGTGCTAANFLWGAPADSQGFATPSARNSAQVIAPIP